VTNKLVETGKRFIADEEAGVAAEYGIIVGIVAVALIGALITFRNELVGVFTDAADALSAR